MEKERRRNPSSRRSKTQDEDVVYTQPKPFRRNRFIMRLTTVLAVVLALLFGLSLFFMERSPLCTPLPLPHR